MAMRCARTTTPRFAGWHRSPTPETDPIVMIDGPGPTSWLPADAQGRHGSSCVDLARRPGWLIVEVASFAEHSARAARRHHRFYAGPGDDHPHVHGGDLGVRSDAYRAVSDRTRAAGVRRRPRPTNRRPWSVSRAASSRSRSGGNRSVPVRRGEQGQRSDEIDAATRHHTITPVYGSVSYPVVGVLVAEDVVPERTEVRPPVRRLHTFGEADEAKQ